MGAVFTSAARAPLTSLASVVEMTGDFTLTLPVMLAVAIATATSRALSYGTIYTTKLLRRGQDIDRAAPWRAFGDLKAADVMRPFPRPLAVTAGPDATASAAPALARLRRAGHLPGRPADRPRQRVPRPGAAPDRGLRPRRAARAVRRRPAGAGLDHRRERAGRRRRRDRRAPAPGRPARAAGQTGNPPARSHPTRYRATRSSRSPSKTARRPQARRSAPSPGQPAASRSPSSATARCRTPSPSLTLTPGDRINLLARAPRRLATTAGARHARQRPGRPAPPHTRHPLRPAGITRRPSSLAISRGDRPAGTARHR